MNSPYKKKEFDAKEFLYIALGIGILMISFSIVYYYSCNKPKIEKQKAFEKSSIENQKAFVKSSIENQKALEKSYKDSMETQELNNLERELQQGNRLCYEFYERQVNECKEKYRDFPEQQNEMMKYLYNLLEECYLKWEREYNRKLEALKLKHK